ncbi:hypothetical protein NIT7321_00683 [Phaeobacter italicus]|uniref:Uncharacterized protein n=1 Tax=Phaeobacter italicus TaxID=481446 RepID=A0A0H5CZ89_9RHOB|nr:hypothetical protein NIT7321_00683 [Phaeobacter italicus]
MAASGSSRKPRALCTASPGDFDKKGRARRPDLFIAKLLPQALFAGPFGAALTVGGGVVMCPVAFGEM